MSREHDDHPAGLPRRRMTVADEIELVHVIAEASDGETAWANRGTALATTYDNYQSTRDFLEESARSELALRIPEGLPISIRIVREMVTVDDIEEV